jgi:hypothetical protein
VADSEDERFLREGDEAKEDVDHERLATMRRVHMEEEDAEAARQVCCGRRALRAGYS